MDSGAHPGAEVARVGPSFHSRLFLEKPGDLDVDGGLRSRNKVLVHGGRTPAQLPGGCRSDHLSWPHQLASACRVPRAMCWCPTLCAFWISSARLEAGPQVPGGGGWQRPTQRLAPSAFSEGQCG